MQGGLAVLSGREDVEEHQDIYVLGEGVAGDVHLEIKSVGATGCADAKQETKLFLRGSNNDVFNNTCTAPVQSNLRYNISKTSAIADFPFPLPQSETLAQAVCCDNAFKAYAEPRETYARPDVNLYEKMNKDGTTISYDVCGIPLFEAPKGRSFEDFKADTDEHGWPSFRPEELIKGNSRIIKETGEVVSKQTHLKAFPTKRGTMVSRSLLSEWFSCFLLFLRLDFLSVSSHRVCMSIV